MLYINKMVVRNWFILLIIIFSFCMKTFSQIKSQREANRQNKSEKMKAQVMSKQSPSDCEYIRAVLDQALIDTQNSDDSYLFVIFHLGEKEKSREINEARIEEIENFMKLRGAPDQYVLAEAKKVNGLGKAKVYVNGKLKGEFFFETNLKKLCKSTW